MKILKHLIFLPLFLAIGLVGKVSAEAGDQVCYPGDNITDSKLFNLKSNNIRKPTLDFWQYYWDNVKGAIWQWLFGSLKLSKTNITHCHPFTEELTNLLMEEYQFSWMEIISDVEIIDDNLWWCKGLSDLKTHMDYFVNPVRSCENLNNVSHCPKFNIKLEKPSQ
jgi:hypothetical protein